MVLDSNLRFEEIAKNILYFVKKRSAFSRRERTTELLKKMGFDFKHSGTIYLLDCILYVNTYKGTYSFEQIKNDVYSQIGKLNNCTADVIKWGIERSINYMYQKHTKESYQFVEKYLGLLYPEKPSSKSIISIIANILEF